MPPPDREQLILEHLDLVRALARRYANRGEALDDLVQIGTVGLIKAIDRFDGEKGASVAAFATPTILGEIRRHFRDKMWTIRVPRSLQEANAAVNHAVDQLTAELRRSPTVREIAEHAGLAEDEVLDAVAAGSAFRPSSLTRATDDEDDDIDIGYEEPGFLSAENRAITGDHVRRLPKRQQDILRLRFEDGLSQSEIASRLGISQMHVSRLLAKSVATLRAQLGADVS